VDMSDDVGMTWQALCGDRLNDSSLFKLTLSLFFREEVEKLK